MFKIVLAYAVVHFKPIVYILLKYLLLNYKNIWKSHVWSLNIGFIVDITDDLFYLQRPVIETENSAAFLCCLYASIFTEFVAAIGFCFSMLKPDLYMIVKNFVYGFDENSIAKKHDT